MKRLSLCVVLLLMSWGPGADAQNSPTDSRADCIQPDGCKAPPCKFMAELKWALASRRAEGMTVGEERGSSFEAEAAGILRQLNSDYNSSCPEWAEEGRQWASKRISPAPPNCMHGVKDASGNLRLVDLEAIQGLRNTCSEIVGAENAMQNLLAQQCLARKEGRAPNTVFHQRQGFVEAIHQQIEHLKNNLVGYLRSCVPDAALAAELTDMGLKDTLDKGKAAYDDWQARRALGGVGAR